MLYGAYFDESDEKPGFAVGGYSAALDTWLHLGWDWQELLDRWGVTYFKASECENLLGQFAQYRDDPTDLKAPLNPSERSRLVKIKTEFIDAICKHHDDLQGYAAVVVTDDFKRLISEDKIARRTLLDKPYYICAQLCLVAAAMPAFEENKRRPLDHRVDIRPVFDSHEEYKNIAMLLFNDFPAKNPHAAKVLLPPSFESDIETIALQVADSLAYEARKLLAQKLRRPDDNSMRMSYLRLKPSVYRIYKLDYKNLKRLMDNQVPDSIPFGCEQL